MSTVYEWVAGKPVQSDESNFEWQAGKPYVIFGVEMFLYAKLIATLLKQDILMGELV